MTSVFEAVGDLAIRAATGVGALARSYRTGRAGKRRRPRFFSSWARESLWSAESYMEDNARHRAAGNSWFYAGVRLLANELVQADFHVQIQRDVDDDPIDVRNHPVERIMRRPNPWMGKAFFMTFVTWWMHLAGDAPLFIMLGNDEQPAELWPLPADKVDPRPGDGDRFIDHYEYTAHGIRYQIPAELIIHWKFANPFDVFRAMPPLVALMMPIDTDIYQATWNLNFFGNDNTMPNAVISLSSRDGRPLNDAGLDAFKLDLFNEYAAFRRKVAVVTDVEIQAQLLAYNHQEMSYTEGRKLSKEEILNGLGLHPGVFDPNATEANAVVADKRVKETANGILTLFAEQLTAELMWRYYGPDFIATFDDIRPADRLLELQELDRAQGALTTNEVRKRFWNLPELALMDGTVNPRGFDLFREAGIGEPSLEEMFSITPATSLAEQQMALADLRKWRTKALASMRRGEGAEVRFISRWIPAEVTEGVTVLLEGARRTEEVKEVFHRAIDMRQPEAVLHEPKTVAHRCPFCNHDRALEYQGHKGLLVCEMCGKTFDPEVWKNEPA